MASGELESQLATRDRGVPYFRWATVVTAFLYAAGYSSVGFGLLLFGVVWMVATRRVFPWHPTRLDLPLGAFAAVLLVSAVMSPYRPTALGVSLMLIVSGTIYLGSFLWLLRRDPRAGDAVLRAWALGAVLAACVGLAVGAVIHGRAEIPRGVGPNGLGTTLALGGILSLALGLHGQGRDRLTWYGSGFLVLVGLLATGSRASLLGWLAGSVYVAWRRLRFQPKRLVRALSAGALALMVAGLLAPQLPLRLPSTIADVSSNRIRIWETSVRMIGVSPWFGTGFGTFQTAYERWKVPRMSPEPFAFNLWLNVAVETGVLGLASGLWMAVAVIGAWRRRQAHRDPTVLLQEVVPALWLGLLVDQLFDNTLFSVSTSAALWLLLALTVVPSGEQGSFPSGRMEGR